MLYHVGLLLISGAEQSVRIVQCYQIFAGALCHVVSFLRFGCRPAHLYHLLCSTAVKVHVWDAVAFYAETACLCTAEYLCKAPATAQTSHQIATVVRTLYMVVAVPSESIAFLCSQHANTAHVQKLLVALQASPSAQLTAAAMFCHVCHIELRLQGSGCELPRFYSYLLKAEVFDRLLRTVSEVGNNYSLLLYLR